MRLLALVVLLAGCANPYADAEKANTIEAWEAYLQTKPSLSQQLAAEQQLQNLLLEKARKTKAVADYNAVIDRFPKVPERAKLIQERSEAAYAAAEKEGTPEAWKQFMKDYPTADSILIKKATNMVDVTTNKDKLKVGEPRVEQVNLAENPNGPKDGWGFFVTVTNVGTEPIGYLNMEVRLLDEAGAKLKAWQYPLVSKTGPGNMPIEDEYTKPLLPGASREWQYTTGEVPEAWSKKVQVVPVAVKVGSGSTL